MRIGGRFFDRITRFYGCRLDAPSGGAAVFENPLAPRLTSLLYLKPIPAKRRVLFSSYEQVMGEFKEEAFPYRQRVLGSNPGLIYFSKTLTNRTDFDH